MSRGSAARTIDVVLRVVLPSLIGIIAMGAWIFALFDVIATDQMLMRNLPNKLAWLFIVVFLWVIGAVAWFMLGRPVGAGFTPGSTATRPSRSWQQDRPGRGRRPPRGIEDRDDWRPDTKPSEPDRDDDQRS